MSWSAFKTLWLPARSQQPEWLDAEDIPVQDLQRNLDDLRWLNRYLGSHWLLSMALQRVWRQMGSPSHLRVLDVGTGAGDIPAVLTRWGERHGVHIAVVAIDSHHRVLQYMRSVQSLPRRFRACRLMVCVCLFVPIPLMLCYVRPCYTILIGSRALRCCKAWQQ